jgi:DNA-binding Xre family transcriptional regulator
MKKYKWYKGSSLDDFLKEEGIYDEVVAQVEKEVIAWQLAQAMKKKKITKKRMAELMKTSRTQVDKLLNPKDGNVTIKTLHKAAAVVGKRFEYKLVDADRP